MSLHSINFPLLLHLLLLLNQRNTTQADYKVIGLVKDFITSMVSHTTTDTLAQIISL